MVIYMSYGQKVRNGKNQSGPVSWVGSGDSDACPSSAQEGNWKLWDVWQHLDRDVRMKNQNQTKNLWSPSPSHLPSCRQALWEPSQTSLPCPGQHRKCKTWKFFLGFGNILWIWRSSYNTCQSCHRPELFCHCTQPHFPRHSLPHSPRVSSHLARVTYSRDQI